MHPLVTIAIRKDAIDEGAWHHPSFIWANHFAETVSQVFKILRERTANRGRQVPKSGKEVRKRSQNPILYAFPGLISLASIQVPVISCYLLHAFEGKRRESVKAMVGALGHAPPASFYFTVLRCICTKNESRLKHA